MDKNSPFPGCCHPHPPGSIAARHARTQRIVHDSTTREPSMRGSWRPGTESWGFRMVIPTEKQGIIPHGFVKWLDSQSFESIEKNASVIGSERKPRSLNTIRIHTASLLSIDGCIVSNVREFTLGTDWKKGTLGVKIDKCIALSGTQSS